MKNTSIQTADRTLTQLLIHDIPRSAMTETEHRMFVDFWFAAYEKDGFCDRFSSPYEAVKQYIGQRFKVLGRCDETACDLEVLPMWHIQLENSMEINTYPEEICKLERNSSAAAEVVVTELIRRARTATPVDYESMALVLHKYGRDLYTRALNTVLAEIFPDDAPSEKPVAPAPCPICNTAEYVYVVSAKNNHTRFQCVCNSCGIGEFFPDSPTEKEAVEIWNLKQAELQQEAQKLRKEYDQFKLQWMIDHGYSLRDLIEEMQAMVDEDHADSNVPTSLQSLFEDWEFGIGFGGSVWPCFEEWLANEHSQYHG